MSCDKCDIIINEVLCFINAKTDVMDEQSIVQICESNFTEEEIENAKSVIYNHLQTSRLQLRKGEGRTKRNLQDIIKVLKDNPNKLPTLVAQNLNRLPPISFDYIDVTTLLKDILVLKKQVSDISSSYAPLTVTETLQTQIQSLRQEIDQVNLSNDTIISSSTLRNSVNQNTHSPVRQPVDKQQVSAESYVKALGRAPPPPPPPTAPRSKTGLLPTKQTATDKGLRSRKKNNFVELAGTQQQYRPIQPSLVRESERVGEIEDEEKFTTVINRKKKRKIVKNSCGQAALTSDKIKVAPRYSYKYVSRFDKSTATSDLENFIIDSGEGVVSVESLKQFKPTTFSSFKLTILKEKEEVFLKSDFWPIGIEYRKFTQKRSTFTVSSPGKGESRNDN
ncbi:hypothetical protein NE865_07272 [Phthorimaea operculella]|nr:hypothetical protein NE865_07272 [Phthorimaea operculella]